MGYPWKRPLWIGGPRRAVVEGHLWMSVGDAVGVRRLQRALSLASATVFSDPLRTAMELVPEMDPGMPVLVLAPEEEDKYAEDEWMPEAFQRMLTPYDVIVRRTDRDRTLLRVGQVYGVVEKWVGIVEELEEAVKEWLEAGTLQGNPERSDWGVVVEEPAVEAGKPEKLRRRKEVHEARVASLGRVVGEAQAEMAQVAKPKLLEIVGRPSGLSSGVEVGEGVAVRLRAEHASGEDMGEARVADRKKAVFVPAEDEEFDITWCGGLLWRSGNEALCAFLRELWRVTRPGGRIILMEEAVTPTGAEEAEERRSIHVLLDLVLGACFGEVSVEKVESVVYPREVHTRCALIQLKRLGVAKRW